MNQEHIGKIIKDIRKKEGLTQEKFAEKYGVTYQAVSKWENGKNIPDIIILKEICLEYHLDLNDLLDGGKTLNNQKKKIPKKKVFVLVVVVILIGIIMGFFLLRKDEDNFQFKTISTTCDNFNLYGSIAYNDNKTSIYISNITYCGEVNENRYKKLECTLYESVGDTKTIVSSYSYEDEPILLDEFLKKVNFNIEHYSKNCNMHQENSLFLEIEATDENNQMNVYKIPLKQEEICAETNSTSS